MIRDIKQEKDIINQYIAKVISEIFMNQIITEESMPAYRTDLEDFMKAMQLKNKVYDYQVMLAANYLTGKYEGKIAYSLINSDDDTYQDLIEFQI